MKYKVIKAFPGVNVGDILELDVIDFIEVYRKGTKISLESDVVENNPEYFEYVIMITSDNIPVGGYDIVYGVNIEEYTIDTFNVNAIQNKDRDIYKDLNNAKNKLIDIFPIKEGDVVFVKSLHQSGRVLDINIVEQYPGYQIECTIAFPEEDWVTTNFKDLKLLPKAENTIINKIIERQKKGEEKYNTTTDRTDLNLHDWINHAQEEIMDLLIYLEKVKEYAK